MSDTCMSHEALLQQYSSEFSSDLSHHPNHRLLSLKGVSTPLATCPTLRGGHVAGCSWPSRLQQCKEHIETTSDTEAATFSYIQLHPATSSYKLRWYGMVSLETGYKLRAGSLLCVPGCGCPRLAWLQATSGSCSQRCSWQALQLQTATSYSEMAYCQ
jgi:hypothetical protein